MDRPKPQPFQARDKLAFLLALVPYLMDHDRVTVTEAAAHFAVDPEQIRDAVNLIAVSGLPGDTSAYQHDDLFDIDWDAFENDDEIVITNRVAIDDSPRFSAREASALIMGLEYLSALPEYADRGAITSLKTKLSRGTSGAVAPVSVSGSQSIDSLAPSLQLIRESVDAGLQLEFDYLNARGDRERRRVDALQVESIDADWYLRGWCHLREAVRTFRLDRISDAVVTDAPIEHRASDVRLPELFEASPDDLEVVIDVEASAMPLLADYIPDGARSISEGGRIRTTLRVSHFHGLKRLIASMPGVVTVVAPDDARAAVADWAAAGVARYR
ncbi:WYL domain-containing protein [Pseudolysinimonas sp.]|uniref:helix-turn-helix transcriptional regulator n=1 Tax=Pseudolysinimonas sp. TaxID=2680009 RepID=UPI00286B9D6F|nr:WYL domain-containing protein [Pseudolysinimonas sp.]